MNGATHIDWQYLDLPSDRTVRIGDLVSADAGGLPIYQVMALSGGRAWLREEHDGIDRIAPLSAFHWKACVAAKG